MSTTLFSSRKTYLPSQGAAAVVTGAAHGIGRSFAYEIVRRGGSVICTDIDEIQLKKTTGELGELGVGRVVPYVCDVRSEVEMKTLSEQAEELLGRPVSLLVNNAGVAAGGKIGEMPLEDWRWCMDINLWGVIHGCHFFVPKLRSLGFGGIVNVASAASFTAWPEMACYNASKAAVVALSETLTAELAGTGIHVTMLCPTGVNTQVMDRARVPEHTRKATSLALKSHPLIASPDAVAQLTLDGLDRKQMYVMPQLDSRMLWRAKRYAPSVYARGVGELFRLLLPN